MKFHRQLSIFAIAILVFCIGIPATCIAQTAATGTVVDKDGNEPLAGASVVLKDADGKIKKYTTTDADGQFSIPLPMVSGCCLEVVMMSYAKRSLPLDSIEFPVIITLEAGNTLLKEVTVKADPIREQGDTVTYNVSSFAQDQDRSIGDVLKRMPGINVDESGKIRYQGEDINKFYIEGSDLLGGKYGIATNGISHDDVGAVEVMENHQPMQVLSGISLSDKAAINLKLKNKAKATWSVHGNIGGGYSSQPDGGIWDGELFTMAAMADFQNITTLKSNNTGDNLTAQTTDFFASRRGTDLQSDIRIALPQVPSLAGKRTLFNRSDLVSTNNLWKLGDGEIKAQIDYSFNRATATATNITTYFLPDGNRVLTEKRDGIDRTHSLSGKFTYELNQKTSFINNTLRTVIDRGNINLLTTGSLSNIQSATVPDYYIANDFKLIKRFKGKHIVTFISNNEWESLPGTLSVNADGHTLSEHIGEHAFYTNESASYMLSLKGITVGLEGGIKGYVRSLSSVLSEMPDEIEGEKDNAVNSDYLLLYATPRFEYWLNRLNFILSTPLSYARYSFDKGIASRSEVYFSPSLRVNWKLSNRVSTGLHAGTRRSPMDLNDILTGFVMSDYRSFRRGVDEFYTTSSHNISANFAYKHARRGLFANAMFMQSWSSNPFTAVQNLYGDYIIHSYSRAKSHSEMFTLSGNVGKTIDCLRGSSMLSASLNSHKSNIISQGSAINSKGTSWAVEAKIDGSILRSISFDYRFVFSSSRLVMNSAHSPWLGSMRNELLMNFMPHKKWQLHVSGEHYRNELTDGLYKNVLLLDTKIVFKFSRRVELWASLTNIFNRRTYNYMIYNQLSSFESQRSLRGREFLISIYLRK